MMKLKCFIEMLNVIMNDELLNLKLILCLSESREKQNFFNAESSFQEF